MKTFVVGVTGASGVVLAQRLVELLVEKGHRVHLTASRSARMVIADEIAEKAERCLLPGLRHERIREWAERDFRAPFASGSAPIDGMVIVPCSMSTVAAVAAGNSDNLLRRAAEVMLKERRPLILVPREAPMSVIQLRNLLEAAKAGAIVIPPVLTFYQQPGDGVAAQIDFIVSRILDHLDVSNRLYDRWGESDFPEPPRS